MEPERGSDEGPAHKIAISRPFFLGIYPVTQQNYCTVMGENPSYFQGFRGGGLDFPVEKVNWHEANTFCQRLSERAEERKAGRSYRLPTEAEWEKAGRGEGKRKYAWGDTFMNGRANANVDGSEDGYRYLAPPGSFETGRSPYGIHDMTGNVAEWVADSYDEHYYQKAPYRDPKGPETGDLKVVRGGSWRETEHNTRLSKRFAAKHWRTDITIGFRCASDMEVGDSPTASK